MMDKDERVELIKEKLDIYLEKKRPKKEPEKESSTGGLIQLQAKGGRVATGNITSDKTNSGYIGSGNVGQKR